MAQLCHSPKLRVAVQAAGEAPAAFFVRGKVGGMAGDQGNARGEHVARGEGARAGDAACSEDARPENVARDGAVAAAAGIAAAEAAADRAFDDARKETFFAALAECLCVTQAAERARTTPQNIWLHRRKDPAFARRWQEALDQGYAEIELKLMRHVRDETRDDVTTITGTADAAGTERRVVRRSPRAVMAVAVRLMQLRQAHVLTLALLREAEAQALAVDAVSGEAAGEIDEQAIIDKVRVALGAIHQVRRERDGADRGGAGAGRGGGVGAVRLDRLGPHGASLHCAAPVPPEKSGRVDRRRLNQERADRGRADQAQMDHSRADEGRVRDSADG
jgi:hypothetical protein